MMQFSRLHRIGGFLASGTADGVRLWDVLRGKEIAYLVTLLEVPRPPIRSRQDFGTCDGFEEELRDYKTGASTQPESTNQPENITNN